MKYFIAFILSAAFCFSGTAQNSDTTFQKQWVLIDSLITKKDLPKSALNKVNQLYVAARTKKLSAQIIKALLYKMSLEDQVNEEDPNRAAALLEKEINETKDAKQKSILYAILANTYEVYLNNNSWRIYQRNKTINFKKEDIATWSADDFDNTITTLYSKALEASTMLQQESLKPYSAIILKGNTENLRPTLYDLLAHKALDHFKNSNNYITKPAYAFEIKEPEALGNAETFLNYAFSSKDSTSHLLKALQLYQQLMQFHKNDPDPSALIDVNIERIEWVNNNGVMENKEALYKQALEEITQLYSNNSNAEQAWYLLAKIYADKASLYKPFGDTTHRFDYVKAKQIIDARLKAMPGKSEGNNNMQRLLADIQDKELSSTVENINTPNTPFRMYISYRNTDTLFARIISAANVEKMKENRYDENFWQKLSKLSYIKSFTQTLPQTNDYQQHAVEIKIDALPPGSYAILASSSKDFNYTKDKMMIQMFDVSSISYLNNGEDYFALHRETGQPLQDIKVKYEIQKYDNKAGKYLVPKSGFKTTDNRGFFSLTNIKEQNEREVTLTFYAKDDTLKIREENYYYPRYYEDDSKKYVTDAEYEKDKANIFFFTDRSIYRPGQIVFFKGIVVTKDRTTTQSKLLQYKDSIKVYLQDVNDKKIDSLNVMLNDYSSFNGTFKLPQNVLTGEFTVEASQFNGSNNFSVEEYKRPKFYVEFDTLKSTYRLNDTIKITGHAKAYAGNAVDGAAVKFNVQRNTRFIYPWMFWKIIRPVSNPQQIADGTIITDADGKFEIIFVAKPDASVDKSTEPVFDFNIDASVTDINGETREGNTSLSVGYKSLQLQLTVPAMADINSFKNIPVSATNLSGQKVPAEVHISIYPLQSPDKLYRDRYWQQPDQYLMSKEEFSNYFPYDEYENESDYHNWKKNDAIFTDAISTDTTLNFKLQTLNFTQGYYAIEATAKDKDSNDVKDIQYMQLYDLEATTLPSLQTNWSKDLVNSAQPGEQAKFVIGTSEQDVFIIQNIKRNTDSKTPSPQGEPAGGEANIYSTYSLSNNKKLITVDVKEEDRKGLGVFYAFVKHNRFYSGGMGVNVPYLDKDLQISYATYRNKTEPGSKENWTIKVSGSRGDKATAELLTSMYDASLDQFKPHEWNVPQLWQTGYVTNAWNGRNCFATNNSEENYLQNNVVRFDKVYDELAVSGENLWNGTYSNTFINVKLRPSNAQLNDVVVVGYGTKLIEGKVAGLQVAAAPKQEKDYDEEFKTIDFYNTNGNHIVNGKIVKNQIAPNGKEDQGKIQIRKNFNETAFFFPQLYADSAGNYSFSFTIPEALTQWKWMSLAHTKDLAFGYNTQTITTQKKLMVQPNMPRFLREGDSMELVAKISNLSDTVLSGQATLELIDALTNEPVDGLFKNIQAAINFTAESNRSTEVKFQINIPFNFNKPLTIIIKAIAKLPSPGGEGWGGEASDGEENTLPVLTNRMLVTESLPLYMRHDGTKEFKFEKLLASSPLSDRRGDGGEATLSNESITVEYTPNPIWYAVQALPYLMEYPHECAEQVFNRFYANTLAAYLVAKHPRIKQVFDEWLNDSLSARRGIQGEALLSTLQKNPELKQVLLEETPWVLDAENETQQKKNIALLFDMIKMSNDSQKALQQLKQMQMDNGAFPWFKGGYPDRYITQYIATSIGRLKKLYAVNEESLDELNDVMNNALEYLDNEMTKDYNNLKKNKADLNKNNISSTQIQYLFMRSYFSDVELKNKTAYNYYYQQAKQYWNTQSEYLKAMVAATLYRTGEQSFILKNIIPSIVENAIEDTAKGMYWKDARWGYYWYQSPIEQQALMIELMNEIAQQENNSKMKMQVNNMRTWLLLNKQTNNWKTTKATADACYALIVNNDDLDADKKVEIRLGELVITPLSASRGAGSEAGSGYFKQRIESKDVRPEMGNITVTVIPQKTSPIGGGLEGASWGAVYWQYFENLDKITSSATPLALIKKLFVEKNTDVGKVLQPVNDGDELRIGDKVVIRIELRSDRDMEYIHLKDMRAAAMEPTNVLSGYKWQDGLGYYEATKDASTNFFISNLPRGTYVFEYPAYITHAGNFSVGIASIQCMYAPEFSSHSEGIRISVR